MDVFEELLTSPEDLVWYYDAATQSPEGEQVQQELGLQGTVRFSTLGSKLRTAAFVARRLSTPNPQPRRSLRRSCSDTNLC